MKTVRTLSLFLFAVRCGLAQYPYCHDAPGTWSDMPGACFDFEGFMQRQQSLETSQPSLAVRGPFDEPAGAGVSVARLRHHPPARAHTAFLHGLRLTGSGKWYKAALEFQRAVAIDPDYSEAHGNLGVEYTFMGYFEDAAAEFRRALDLDSATGVHHANLAYALIRLRRLKAAEPEAQAAVSLDPANPKAHYLLGYLLANHPESRDSAAQHLLFAARQVPEAHLVLANLYSLEGARQLAAVELAAYRKAAGVTHP